MESRDTAVVCRWVVLVVAKNRDCSAKQDFYCGAMKLNVDGHSLLNSQHGFALKLTRFLLWFNRTDARWSGFSVDFETVVN